MSFKKDKLYSLLPIFLQKIACNLEGKKIYKKRYSTSFFEKFKEIKKRDTLEIKSLKLLQLRRLKKQLIIAYENTKYYHDLFDSHSFNPYDFNSLEQLYIFPIQVKDTVRKNVQNIQNKKLNVKKLNKIHTSGTTGKGLIYFETIDCDNERWAIWWRFRKNLGIDFNMWSANFGSKTIVPISHTEAPFYRDVNALNQTMFSMFHLNLETVEDYVNKINRDKIFWIHGFPSILATLANLMYEKKLSFTHEIKYVTFGAEGIKENQKNIIKKIFNVEPIGHYGLTEPVVNISICKNGKHHIDEDFSYVEFIPIEGTTNKFKLIGTSFSNDAFFFLRYDTNDIVTVNNNSKCDCNLTGRIVEKVEGRYEDTIHLKNGSKIWFLGDAFKDMINVKGVQVYQYKDYSIDFNIIINKIYNDKDELLLKKEIEKRIDCEYKINYVDKLINYKSNKQKFSFSELN